MSVSGVRETDVGHETRPKKAKKLNGECSADFYFPGKEFWKRGEGKDFRIVQEKASLIS